MDNLIPLILVTLVLALAVFTIIAAWKIYEKAGQPGWASLVPIYNTYIMLKIVGLPGWWLLLFLIPFVNIIISAVVAVDLAKVFGKGTLYGIFLIWFFPMIGYLILGFGSDRYVGISSSSQPIPNNPPPSSALPSQQVTPPLQTSQ